MALAPVRAAPVLVHDGFDGAEERLVRGPCDLVDGEVGGVAAVRGGEEGVVGCGEPQLDREQHGQPPVDDQRPDPLQRLGGVDARDRVLHLREADPPPVRVDPVTVVELLVPADRTGDGPGDPGRRTGEEAAQVAGGAQARVAEHVVVPPRGDPAGRSRGAVGAARGVGQDLVRVRQRHHLEVVVRGHERVQTGQHLAHRAQLVHPVDAERGDAAQRVLGDHTERPERDPRRPPGVRVARLVDLGDLTGGGDQPAADDIGRQIGEALPGAVGGGGHRPGQGLGVDVALVLQRQPVPVEFGGQAVQLDTGLDPHQAGRPVDVEDAPYAALVHHDAVGEAGVGERVPAAHGPDPQTVPGRAGERLAQLLLALRAFDADGGTALLAGPVAPLLRHYGLLRSR
ncbi:hypothetical protein YUWDRAFT_04662 [Streptomyces sp. AmelKG-D3]|nr:hypothetical protein YUWDRAFT_04662 [Streptomyces sp. AmelKG-D3]